MYITRRQVLQAIRFEPLQPGNFVKLSTRKIKGKCPVCAVGATLRRVGYNDVGIDLAGDALMSLGRVALDKDWNPNDTLEEVLADAMGDKHYLRALSMMYEALSDKHKTPTVRRKLAVWVKANLPVRFKAEINERK